MTQNSTHRIGFKFWLNLDKPHEEAIADTIEILKNQRSFTQTIRNGIRLIVDLQAGNTDVLFELFPFVKTKLQMLSDTVDQDTHEIKEDIARLEQLILEQRDKSDGSRMLSAPQGLSPIGGLQSLARPSIQQEEEIDDIDLIVTKASSTEGQSVQNFLASIQKLQD